ncbi:MAG TPA: hypothetical protein VE133_13200, partial [Candidatus Sulfotelmatobacter sp.]|nr:hypothetical protein [Candidatus Sulfotelmatobacter sp.]
MDKLNIGAGAFAIVYMWLNFDGPAKVPAGLEHVITVQAGKGRQEITVQCAHVAIGKDIAVISAPLRGDNWQAGNGPSNSSGHRRTILPINGKAAIAQRFAIDWVRLNADGKTFKGDEKDNKSYRAYGSEALAGADGTIVAIKDGSRRMFPAS